MTEKRSNEIGHVTFSGGRAVLTLWGPDDWTYELDGESIPEVAGSYRMDYLGQYQGPEYGYYGQLLLQIVARDVQGTATIVQEFPAGLDEDGRQFVYKFVGKPRPKLPPIVRQGSIQFSKPRANGWPSWRPLVQGSSPSSR